MKQYSYDGMVKLFDKVICHRWQGSTYAVSESKARSNLTYQFKKERGWAPCTKISLPEKLTVVE